MKPFSTPSIKAPFQLFRRAQFEDHSHKLWHSRKGGHVVAHTCDLTCQEVEAEELRVQG